MDRKEQFIVAIQQSENFIYKLASAYTKNIEDRQDLVQEIIYQLWKSYPGFKERAMLSTWIYRVSLNVSIYQLKKSKRILSTVPINEEVLNFQESDFYEKEEQWKLFRQQIESLNLLDKGIVMLYLENKSHDEIAEIIGISKSNVGTKLSRIKEKMKTGIIKKS